MALTRTFDVSITVHTPKEFTVCVTDVESGSYMENDFSFSPFGSNACFDDWVGRELYSWVGLMVDELVDQTEDQSPPNPMFVEVVKAKLKELDALERGSWRDSDVDDVIDECERQGIPCTRDDLRKVGLA